MSIYYSVALRISNEETYVFCVMHSSDIPYIYFFTCSSKQRIEKNNLKLNIQVRTKQYIVNWLFLVDSFPIGQIYTRIGSSVKLRCCDWLKAVVHVGIWYRNVTYFCVLNTKVDPATRGAGCYVSHLA